MASLEAEMRSKRRRPCLVGGFAPRRCRQALEQSHGGGGVVPLAGEVAAPGGSRRGGREGALPGAAWRGGRPLAPSSVSPPAGLLRREREGGRRDAVAAAEEVRVRPVAEKTRRPEKIWRERWGKR
nr:unnamed protein product [Digitaria exilis]